MNWSDAMKENADRVAADRVFTNTSDAPYAPSIAWSPHDVWLTRVKQPRDRAAIRRTAVSAAVQTTARPGTIVETSAEPA